MPITNSEKISQTQIKGFVFGFLEDGHELNYNPHLTNHKKNWKSEDKALDILFHYLVHGIILIFTGKPAYHDEHSNLSTQSDTRSIKRAELIQEAKEKAWELRADAIIGVKLETNANAGMFGVISLIRV